MLTADRYRLLEVLGRGGMGEVWRAEDTTLDREVAVKLLLDRTAVPDAVERFRQEARTAAGLAAAHRAGVVHRDIKPGNLPPDRPCAPCRRPRRRGGRTVRGLDRRGPCPPARHRRKGRPSAPYHRIRAPPHARPPLTRTAVPPVRSPPELRNSSAPGAPHR
ncbi:hypothetical protein [Streptomyces halobius]|uniref:non-specific serine/threonine protein kinase n=1 Tax=Streptomyces halobius TaxID=2879846 RepID=A0ABY4M2L4_9ACTN|nr:hypothetical protein [Streptomyces halobius]UQA92015.1 hypothetical protein K9S39_09285 [Streptomyces halobius]